AHSVGNDELGDEAVTSEKLADGAVTITKLALRSITSSHIIPGSITTDLVDTAAITREKLAPELLGELLASVPVQEHAETLKQGSITGELLAAGAVSEGHIQDNSIEGRHIREGAICAGHIADGSLNPSKLSFQPIHTPTGLTGEALQQFGVALFAFEGMEEQLDIVVAFDDAFKDQSYVMTASTNQPYCHAYIKQKFRDFAVISVVRQRIGVIGAGELNWIAVG
ncbi:WIAG-tail domain, partial [Paenibacillus tarimensis]